MTRQLTPARIILGLLSPLLLAGCANLNSPGMTPRELAEEIRGLAGGARVEGNVVEFEYEGVTILAVSDEIHDRMRLIAPITTVDQIEAQHLAAMLIANFHTSLDGRYAISDGSVFAAFLHPLASLDTELLASAIRQVAALKRNFATTYSSDELVFGADAGQEV